MKKEGILLFQQIIDSRRWDLINPIKTRERRISENYIINIIIIVLGDKLHERNAFDKKEK